MQHNVTLTMFINCCQNWVNAEYVKGVNVVSSIRCIRQPSTFIVLRRTVL